LYLTKDNSYVRLRMSNQEIDFGRVSFNHFTIRSHIIYDIPTLNGEIIDNTGYFDDSNFPGDGTLVEISMGTSENKSSLWIPFRIFNVLPTNNQSQSRLIRFSAYFNAPGYFWNHVSKCYRSMSSSDLIKTIAQENNLNVYADGSNDVMSWRCCNKPQSDFIKNDVINYAFLDEESCYAIGFSHSFLGIKFVNLSKAVLSEPKFTLSETTAGRPNYLVSESKSLSRSGVLNSVSGGYGMEVKGFNLETSSFENHRGAKIVKSDFSLDLNSEFSVSKSLSNLVFAPLSIGNEHPNYHKACGQNLRAKSLYSQSTELLVNSVTEIDLFDSVEFVAFKMPGQMQEDFTASSKYLVSGRFQMVTPNGYAEKIFLTRNSSPNKNPSLVR
jgi:hypothetical protein